MVGVHAYIAAGLGLLSAAAFLYVGILFARRSLPPAHKPAGIAFSAAWLAASAYAALSAVIALAPAQSPMAFGLVAGWIGIILATVMVGGLVAYLAYLITGRRAAVPIVSALYASQTLALVVFLTILRPRAATTNGWTVSFEFPDGTSVNGLLSVLLLGPTLVASLVYLGMIFKAEDLTTRWRIALVGGGLTIWSTAALMARMGPWSEALVIARAAGALLAVAVILAYAPPAPLRRRWAIGSVQTELPRPPSSAAKRAAHSAALTQRAIELV